jgi:hypothetical protein
VSITTDLLHALALRNSIKWQRCTQRPGKRALWFATIYAASVAVFAAVAGLLSMIVPN